MGHWTTESSKAMWERIKSDPVTFKTPPLPKQGEIDITAICRHTPIRIGWNCEANLIFIDGKPVRVLHESGWAYKVRRHGIYTTYGVEGLIRDIVKECADDGAMDSMYYDMLKKAKELCIEGA